MEKYKIAVVYDHRGRTVAEKEGPLEVRITVGRKAYYINTGVHVRRDEWAGTVINRRDCDILNEKLALVVERVNTEIMRLQRGGWAIDAQVIRKRLWDGGCDRGNDSFIKWIESQLPLLGLKDDTLKHYDTLLKRLREYGGITSWADLTVENIYNFNAWLHKLTKPQNQADRLMGVKPAYVSDAGVYNYHKTLKAMINRAVKMGKAEKNPYDMLRGEFKRGDKENVEYLTEDEMKSIMSLRPVPGSQMAIAKDLFVFQMFMGMSYSDTQKFDINDYKLVDGQWIAASNRIKTGTAYIAHLLSPVVEILERYGMNTPKINNADYNHALKAIQYAAGITTRLHSHLGRHSFATFMLANDVPLQNVTKMLGHKSVTQTLRYAKVLASDVHKDYDMIESKLSEKGMK